MIIPYGRVSFALSSLGLTAAVLWRLARYDIALVGALAAVSAIYGAVEFARNEKSASHADNKAFDRVTFAMSLPIWIVVVLLMSRASGNAWLVTGGVALVLGMVLWTKWRSLASNIRMR